jgi:hypothetical protein
LQEVAAQPALPDSGVPHGPAPRVDVTGGAAGRTFHRGAILNYGYQVLNARTGAGAQPELEVQARLFHDGEQVLASKLPPPTTGSASDPRNLAASGRMTLGSDLAPGVYVLQVAVTDKLATGKFSTVTESQDFEIEP